MIVVVSRVQLWSLVFMKLIQCMKNEIVDSIVGIHSTLNIFIFAVAQLEAAVVLCI